MKKVMTKIVSVVLTVVMLLGAAPLSGLVGLELPELFSFESEALASGDFTYTVSGSNATITGYSGTATDLIIPSNLGGYKVTVIDRGAFANNKTLANVTIPGTIERISVVGSGYTGAFENCIRLKNVTLKEGADDANLSHNSFRGCTALEQIVIPGNYTNIGSSAFENCVSLKSMVWEKSSALHSQTILNSAFKGCTNLSDVSFSTTLTTIGANAFNGCVLTSLVIPEGVTSISYGAFANNKKLTSVSLPSTITQLSVVGTGYSGAFQDCVRLSKVTLKEGDNDANLSHNTFRGCTALETIIIPGNYTNIGCNAFDGCVSLVSMTLEKSPFLHSQAISASAFKGCTNLSNVSLPTTLTTIGSEAFYGCAITSLIIPEGVTSISYGAFANNKKLTEVYIPGTVTQIGAVASGYTGVFEDCSYLETVIIDEGLSGTEISYYTFKNCGKLTSIHLPLNLLNIKRDAFCNVSSNLKICSKSSSSYGQTYASANGFAFIICDGHSIKSEYIVYYNANGGSVAPSSVEVVAKKSTTLPTPTKSYTVSFNANGGSSAPASQKAALTCLGWSTSASATTATYSCGAAFAPKVDTTLYAVWNANASFTVPSGVPTRDGYEFLGWAASNSSTTASIHAGDRVNVSGNVTYYAVWKEIPSLTVSQTELTLDLDNVDTGFATVTVNRPSNEALTLEAASSSTSVVMVELGEYDSTDDTCPATFIVKGEGTCTVTFKLYSADKSVLYDTETVTITVKQDATKQINMNYNGVTVIDDFDGVYFESLNPDVATVDDNGKITATGRGTAIILVTDIDGNISYYSITVNFTLVQWIIYIVFFGWLWY